MLVFTHPACLGHDAGPEHPESPPRLTAVVEALREAFTDLDWREAPLAKLGDLCRVHEREQVDAVLETNFQGYHQLDVDTLMSPGSRAAALRAAGAGIAAVDAVMQDGVGTAFCAVRPPGHHATGQVSMGFCLFNNIAVAAAHARDRHGLERITVVDFDVHHGNGTQAIFERDPTVQYLSTHQSGLYPHSGSVHERGIGNIHNLLLPPGSDGLRFRNVWEDEMLPLIDAFRPQLILISAGFDAHLRDPLADLMLDADDFAWLTAALRALANRHARGRVVSMLEGGYDLQALRESSVAHVGALR
ncbi:histone deacetylase family protein [Xanthomonas campestris pv. raphani]|uniref:histone deacetylase family protein n=1 Tax=Xanthomonas campestris TaxID=339 RepID=UPI001E394045|nr:histone deacetylase family protein [Xanthomonas campestris]MCC8486120.1 histone deacetylase family protein [Xanthomonas campestris]MEA9649711.1 histone deacetylase family protein [Xanthomonas campestris pv. raphani]MEA9741951.1 histone deacetylase family protein [Xanthomonas campestris pv. raphani]MEA9766883.1 histone deacetylase family protein [Xanthomonas campestris pv. raphani]MEA9868131.1 histone deacetylase family protein [Xanthomonas campestris pv. raphani]